MTTNYENMKIHFDKLIKGGYPTSHGLESIRSVYEDTFNRKINLYDVYQTDLKVSTNPVGGLITLIGPNDDTLPEGFIMNEDGKVYYVKQFTNDIMKDIDFKELKAYTNCIFYIMRDIVEFDAFKMGERFACTSPYLCTVYAYPLYFTFHHIRDCFPALLDTDLFMDIMEKHYMDMEDIPTVLNSLNDHKYTTDPNKIYNIMTCGNTIPII